MSDKAIVGNGETLEFVPNCYKNQQTCNKAVANYPHALKFVPDCYITQKMCDKADNTFHSTIKFISHCCKTREMCNIKLKECVIKLLMIVWLHQNLFLIGLLQVK